MKTVKNPGQKAANACTDARKRPPSFAAMKQLIESLDPTRSDQIKKASGLNQNCPNPDTLESYIQQNPHDVPYVLRMLIDRRTRGCDCISYKIGAAVRKLENPEILQQTMQTLVEARIAEQHIAERGERHAIGRYFDVRSYFLETQDNHYEALNIIIDLAIETMEFSAVPVLLNMRTHARAGKTGSEIGMELVNDVLEAYRPPEDAPASVQHAMFKLQEGFLQGIIEALRSTIEQEGSEFVKRLEKEGHLDLPSPTDTFEVPGFICQLARREIRESRTIDEESAQELVAKHKLLKEMQKKIDEILKELVNYWYHGFVEIKQYLHMLSESYQRRQPWE